MPPGNNIQANLELFAGTGGFLIGSEGPIAGANTGCRPQSPDTGS